MPIVCLNMIVRNEAHVIERCLRSVRPAIDAWCIVDTGSSDGTQELVRNALSGLPGELVERPWRDFGHNRSEALELAKGWGDYLLLIDADAELVVKPLFDRRLLSADSYALRIDLHGTEYWRPALVASRLGWRYEGVLHEYLYCPDVRAHDRLHSLAIKERGGGARSQDPRKYARDAELLERAVLADPANPRNVFYLAQSHRDAGNLSEAILRYEQRSIMGGWDEEAWQAAYEFARLSERTGLDLGLVIDRYLAAYKRRPTRAEPLVDAARLYRMTGQWELARDTARQALGIERPADTLFVNAATYDWRARDEYAVACYWLDDWGACIDECRALLKTPGVPAQDRWRVAGNMASAQMRLKERVPHDA